MQAQLLRVWLVRDDANEELDPYDEGAWTCVTELYVPDMRAAFNAYGVVAHVDERKRYEGGEDVLGPPHGQHSEVLGPVVLTPVELASAATAVRAGQAGAELAASLVTAVVARARVATQATPVPQTRARPQAPPALPR